MDFANELEQISAGVNRRVEELDGLAPDTPHPTCGCGRSLNDHLASEIEGLGSLLELMANGDSSRFTRYVDEYEGERNGHRAPFAISQIWRYPSLPEGQRIARCMETAGKIEEAFPGLLESLSDDTMEVEVVVIEIPESLLALLGSGRQDILDDGLDPFNDLDEPDWLN